MEYPLAIICTPLPPASAPELEHWRRIFEAALAPWLDERQLAHVRRFGRPYAQDEKRNGPQEAQRAGLSRLLARAQLVAHVAQQPPAHGAKTSEPSPRLGMDCLGRPQFPGWHAAFSHSGTAAFCALCPAPSGAAATAHALDAESLLSTPPASNAFAPAELYPNSAGLSQPSINREALRRWTIKEALLKASGLGLGINPANVPTGSFGQRAGVWRGPLGASRWRGIPCPGHWLCLAWQPETNADFRSPVRWMSAHELLHRLAGLYPRG